MRKSLAWIALDWRIDKGRHRVQGKVVHTWEKGRYHLTWVSHKWCLCWQPLFFCSSECRTSLSRINSACIKLGNCKPVLHTQDLFTHKEIEWQTLNFFGLCLVESVMDGCSTIKMMWRGECKMRSWALQPCFCPCLTDFLGKSLHLFCAGCFLLPWYRLRQIGVLAS